MTGKDLRTHVLMLLYPISISVVNNSKVKRISPVSADPSVKTVTWIARLLCPTVSGSSPFGHIPARKRRFFEPPFVQGDCASRCGVR
jgi:hypothetical protein